MADDNSETLIGYVTDVCSGGLTARLLRKEEGFAPVVRVGDEKLLVGQINSYAVVRQYGLQLLTMISRMSEKPADNGEVDKILELILLGEIGKNGNFQRGVRHYPATGAELHAVGVMELKSIFSQFSQYGFTPGYLPSHRSLEASLDPSILFGRHFAILGQSGSGKSWTVTNLVQRAVKCMPKAHIIILDLHGEYSWETDEGERKSAFTAETVRYVDARELEIPFWLMTFAELVDLLIDRTDSGSSVQTAFLRETIYSLKKKSAKQLGIETVSIDSPIYFSIQELYEEFKEANEQRSDFGKTQGALFGQFDEFMIKLGSKLNDVRYDFLLKPKKRTNSASLSGLLRDFVGLGVPKRPITIIDLSPVPFDVRPTVSAQIGRLAFEFNYWNPRNREFPILLLCEEAHAYIPRDSDVKYEGTRKSMERIAKEGRKYGVGLGVVSQRPHELSETVLAQCATFLCLRITNPDDQAYIRKLVPQAEGNLMDTLSSLGRGEMMVMGEAAPLPLRIQGYQPNPPPNSNDVDYHEQWRNGPDDLDVDAIVDLWRRQGR